MASYRLLALCALLLVGCTTAASNMDNITSPSELPGYSQGYDRAFGAALDAVALMSWEVSVAQKDAGLITAKTPVSLTTWGDKVTIRLFRPDSTRNDTLTRIAFTSGTDQAIDWGKNKKNRRKFFEKLNGILSGTVAAKKDSASQPTQGMP